MSTDRPWYNSAFPNDVDDDGQLTPSDAILVINSINNDGGRLLPTERDSNAAPFLDTDHDGYLAPLDALLVINELNAELDADGEYYLALDEKHTDFDLSTDNDLRNADFTPAVDAAFLEIGMSEYNTPTAVTAIEMLELGCILDEDSDELDELVTDLLGLE